MNGWLQPVWCRHEGDAFPGGCSGIGCRRVQHTRNPGHHTCFDSDYHHVGRGHYDNDPAADHLHDGGHDNHRGPRR